MITFALRQVEVADAGGIPILVNDIYAEAGQIALVKDGDETAQTIDTRISTFRGDFFYDQNYGIPYWQALQNADAIEALNMAIKRTIEGTLGVVKIRSFNTELNPTLRTYSIEAIVNTEYNQSQDLTITQTYGR
jgi:hypothetical protein